MLAKRIENRLPSSNVLRAYQGSLTSLVKMYQGEGSIVSLHLFDGETGTYNIPYVKRILVGQPCLMINLLSRKCRVLCSKRKSEENKDMGWHIRDYYKVCESRKGFWY